MEITYIFTFSVALIAIFISLWATTISKKTLKFQILHELLMTYSTSEMMSAIASLREFGRNCERNKLNIEDEFLKIYQPEKKKVTEKTLNYKRRLVFNFYIQMATLHVKKILPPELIFDLWLPSDLDILDKYLIPMNMALTKKLNVPPDETNVTLSHLNKLQKDGVAYFIKNKY